LADRIARTCCQQVQRQVPQTTFRAVAENKVVNYTVMVPQRVERQVTVPVSAGGAIRVVAVDRLVLEVEPGEAPAEV